MKSRISDDNDLIRGIFQCIKYKAVLEAKRFVESYKVCDPLVPTVRVAPVIGRELAEPHIKLRNIFGTDIYIIIDN